MKIVVCIKQVVTREWQLRVNEQKTWIRDQDASFELNEPDAYALEEALRLKEKHGGEVIVCSAGPARATQVIREALARGADRAVHVESDALATAAANAVADALAEAIKGEQVDLVLTGLQSDDQGFGQVGVVLAEKLGMPHATIIMEVQKTEAGLSVKRELEGGWFQWVALPLPALLTIQSGINQLRYATLKGIMAAKKKEIKKVVPPVAAGAAPPPGQRMTSVYFPEKGKKTQMLTGAPADAARELVRRLREDAKGTVILVIAEHRDGALNRATLETIAAAQQTDAAGVKVAVLGSSLDAIAHQVAAAAVAEVIVVDDPALQPYTADGFVLALAQVIAAEKPDRVFLPHTYQTRDFAPALAVRVNRPLVTDCVAVKGDGYVRPVFQGKLQADVAVDGPHIATFQIGAFRADAMAAGPAPAPTRTASVSIDAAKIRQKPEAPFKEAKQAVDLSQAERIVAVGRGIKGQEHVQLAQQLAQAMGAELAASRPICDAGWLPMDRQIGSSGQTVAPRLYVALGISGAIQHLVGMKGARTIVAVNKDPEAPIFEIADYGIAGDLFEVVPAMIAELKK